MENLIGETLYIIKGNFENALRNDEQFGVDVIETKIVKKCTNYRIYAGSVEGYQTEEMIFGSNWFTEDWLDKYDSQPIYFRLRDKRCGTQIIITLKKELIEGYKKELLKELNDIVSDEWRKHKKRLDKVLSLTNNLEYFRLIRSMKG